MQAANSNKQNKFGKDVFKAVFLILTWVIIISLAKDALHVDKGFGRVEEANLRLKREEEKNVILKKKYEVVRTEEYRERLIREQLNMQKEGEVIAVLPKKTPAGFVPKIEESANIPNWRKWLDLIY